MNATPADAPPPPLLDVRGLCTEVLTAAGPRPILSDVTFAVGRGETLALVGESGSGKSMTMQALLGLLPPPALATGGSALFEGADLLTLPESGLRRLRGDRIGCIFQEPMSALDPLMAVGDQIAEPLVVHRGLSWRAARAESLRLLDRTRVADAARVARLRPHELSGGMRQRVVIAAAIACRPALIFADEPTTALDASVQAEIMALLSDLRRDVGCAIVLITHDMGVVASFADRTAVMLRGRVTEHGPTRQIVTAARTDYTRTLVAAALPSKAEALPEPDPAAVPALAIRDLRVSFPLRGLRLRPQHLFAVDGVSLSLAPGETLALVGESGSGKTSLARAILGLAPIADGAVWIDGNDLRDRPDRARSRVQYVFQDPQASLDPQFRAWRTVTEPLRIGGLKNRDELRHRAAALMAQVGLDAAHLDRMPHEISGGQRQRLGIARALAAEPRVLIADEAVAALDAATRLQVLDLFRDLQRRRGLAYLFITHDIGTVTRIAHRIAIMRFGCLVETGPVASVLEHPRHPYSRLLLAGSRWRGEPNAPQPNPARLRVGPAGSTVTGRMTEVGPGHLVAIDDA